MYLGHCDPVPLSGFVRQVRDAMPFTCNYFDFA